MLRAETPQELDHPFCLWELVFIKISLVIILESINYTLTFPESEDTNPYLTLTPTKDFPSQEIRPDSSRPEPEECHSRLWTEVSRSLSSTRWVVEFPDTRLSSISVTTTLQNV